MNLTTFKLQKKEEDLKAFIRSIRESYPNKKMIIKTISGKIIKCYNVPYCVIR